MSNLMEDSPVMRHRVLNLISKVRSRGFKFLERSLAEAGIENLSPAHGDILYALSQSQPLNMRQLAAITGRDKSTLTPLVDRLIRDGYLMRREVKADRRSFQILLTERALKLRPRLVQIGRKLEKQMLNGIGESELDMLLQGLQKMYDNLPA